MAAWQEYAGTHAPPLQFVEQQSTPEVHVSPSTLHTDEVPVIVVHLPPEQLPLQQLLWAEQVPPKSTQLLPQKPLSQRLVQQSVLAVHVEPAAAQGRMRLSQMLPAAALQVP